MTDETNQKLDMAPAAEAASPSQPAPVADSPPPASSEPALLAKAPEPPLSRPPLDQQSAYETFKLPEGVAVDADSLAAATELFRSSALNQEQAQKFIDLAVSREQAAAQKGVQAFVDLQNKWFQRQLLKSQ
jgi:hypothetical protein